MFSSGESRAETTLTNDSLSLYLYILTGVFAAAIVIAFVLITWLFIIVKRIQRKQDQNIQEFKIRRPTIRSENVSPKQDNSYPDENRMSVTNGRNPLSQLSMNNNPQVGGYRQPSFVNELKHSRNFNPGGKINDSYSPSGSEYFNKVQERSKFTY